MMDETQIISIYENVAEITDRMLHAARAGDWDLLTQLEQDCSSQVEVLRDQDTPIPLAAEMRDKKIRIIKKILADDREIRDLTEPWMAQLANIMKNSDANRMLSSTYGSYR